MGEKETSSEAGDDAARKLNVSATPGGSESAGIVSAAVSSVGNLAPPTPAGAASSPAYAEPKNAGEMPSI
jgi:hypothetical protein